MWVSYVRLIKICVKITMQYEWVMFDWMEYRPRNYNKDERLMILMHYNIVLSTCLLCLHHHTTTCHTTCRAGKEGKRHPCSSVCVRLPCIRKADYKIICSILARQYLFFAGVFRQLVVQTSVVTQQSVPRNLSVPHLTEIPSLLATIGYVFVQNFQQYKYI